MTVDSVSQITSLSRATKPVPVSNSPELITFASIADVFVTKQDYFVITSTAFKGQTVDQLCNKACQLNYIVRSCVAIGRVSLARENEAGGSWGQEVHILHVNV